MPNVSFEGNFALHNGFKLDSDERIEAIQRDYRALLAVPMPEDKRWIRKLKDLAFCYVAGLSDIRDEEGFSINDLKASVFAKRRATGLSRMKEIAREKTHWSKVDKQFDLDASMSREPIDKLLSDNRGRRPISFQKAVEICVGLEAYAKYDLEWDTPEDIYRRLTIVPAAFVIENLERRHITEDVLAEFSSRTGQPLSQSALVRIYEDDAAAEAFEDDESIREVWRTPEAIARYRPVTLITAAILRNIIFELDPASDIGSIIQVPSSRVKLPNKVDKYETLTLSDYLTNELVLSPSNIQDIQVAEANNIRAGAVGNSSTDESNLTAATNESGDEKATDTSNPNHPPEEQ